MPESIKPVLIPCAQVTKLELECPPPRSAARLLDKLCGHFIEDNIASQLPCWLV